jgi:hypothetical protein
MSVLSLLLSGFSIQYDFSATPNALLRKAAEAATKSNGR